MRSQTTGNWWLIVGGEFIGFYPRAAFAGGPLFNNAAYVDFGGETTGILATAEMGSGRFAHEGVKVSAFQSRLQYFDSEYKLRSASVMPVTSDSCYSILVNAPADPEAEPGTYIYFGGPGTRHFTTPLADESVACVGPP